MAYKLATMESLQKELILLKEENNRLTRQNYTLTRNLEDITKKYWEMRRDIEANTNCVGGVMTAEKIELHVKDKVRDAYPDLWYSPDPGPGYLEGLGHFNRQLAFE